MASMISPLGAQTPQTTGSADTTKKTTEGNADIASKDQFLKLLVAQIKNQDPLKPADGVQFLTQLTQFSQLEQLMGIRQDLATVEATATPTQAA